MKSVATLGLLLVVSGRVLSAQQPESTVPKHFRPAFAILQETHPKVDAKKFRKFPADTVWRFQAPSGTAGPAKVGFRGGGVIYMTFRRGVGGRPWTAAEAAEIHRRYSELSLWEWSIAIFRGPTDPPPMAGSVHRTTLRPSPRKDFDIESLRGGL